MNRESKTKGELALGNQITIDGGKYTIVNELNEGGRLRALRYGEEWRDLTGDGIILALYHEIERYRGVERRLSDEVIGRAYVTTDKQVFGIVGKVSEILHGGDTE